MAGDRDAAATIVYRYCPLIRFENQPRINLVLRKLIYLRRGVLASPRARAPFAAVDDGTLADLDDPLQRPDLTRQRPGVGFCSRPERSAVWWTRRAGTDRIGERRRGDGFQNCARTASCITLGSPAVVMLPNAALPNTPFGGP